jgi:ferredoxin
VNVRRPSFKYPFTPPEKDVMKITVDAWKCQSHLQCVAIAPELFEYDAEHSYTVAIKDHVPEALERAARDAVRQCPERAIEIKP